MLSWRLSRSRASAGPTTSSRIAGGSGAGSTSPNIPSRAHTRPTPPRRIRWEKAEITERAGSQPPPGMKRNHAAGQQAETHPPEPGRRDRFSKGFRLRKAPDRFDKIPVGVGVAGDGLAKRRNDIERIKVVNRIEPRHIDAGKFQTEKTAARPQHAMELGKR